MADTVWIRDKSGHEEVMERRPGESEDEFDARANARLQDLDAPQTIIVTTNTSDDFSDPVYEWTVGCERAMWAVEDADFETRGQVAIAEGRRLLGLACRLAGREDELEVLRREVERLRDRLQVLELEVGR